MGEKLLKAFEFALYFVVTASCAYVVVWLDLSTNARERFAGNFMTVCGAVLIVAVIDEYTTKRIPASWKAAARRVRQAVKVKAGRIWEGTSRAREISVLVSFLLGVVLLGFDAYRTGQLTQRQVEALAAIMLGCFLFLAIGTLIIHVCSWLGGLWERHQESQREYWYWFRHSPPLPLPRGRE